MSLWIHPAGSIRRQEGAFEQQVVHKCLGPRPVLLNEIGVLRVGDAIGPAGTTDGGEGRIMAEEGVRYQKAERRPRTQLAEA